MCFFGTREYHEPRIAFFKADIRRARGSLAGSASTAPVTRAPWILPIAHLWAEPAGSSAAAAAARAVYADRGPGTCLLRYVSVGGSVAMQLVILLLHQGFALYPIVSFEGGLGEEYFVKIQI